MSTIDVLQSKLSKYGQSHLLQFWNDLNNAEREKLKNEIDEINFDAVINDFKTVSTSIKSSVEQATSIEPIPASLFGKINQTSEEIIDSYQQNGLRLIANGKVALLVLAGGVGTRLGVSYPKGMYDVGLPSHKTLFQIQAERIRKLSELASKSTGIEQIQIPWFIMTSESTKEPTLSFLEKNNFFGLERESVVLFEQYMLPAFDFDGKILMQDKDKIALSPDGNGGIYKALKDRGILNEMEKKGIEFVHAFSIDNILVKVGDPIFIGYCAEKNADCGVKVIEKVLPEEAIGVVCKVDNKWKVVEYSEISPTVANQRAADGSLVFKAGNICNHMFNTRFLRKIANEYISQIEHHIAKKKIQTIDSKGEKIKPKTPNGIKMEKFIFDVFPCAEKLVVWQVNRDEEFSALKNSDGAGIDCPSTARKDLFTLHKKWLENAGARFKEPEPVCEISPIISYSGECLEGVANGKLLESPFVLESDTN